MAATATMTITAVDGRGVAVDFNPTQFANPANQDEERGAYLCAMLVLFLREMAKHHGGKEMTAAELTAMLNGNDDEFVFERGFHNRRHSLN